MENVVIFVRCSSELQEFQRQIDELSSIAVKKDWNVVRVISEKISGAKSNKEREGIQELRQVIKEGGITKIMCAEISRLGRSTLDTLNLIEKIHKAGISIYFQDLDRETLDKDGEISFEVKLMIHTLSLFAENERRNHLIRISSGIKAAQNRGVHCGRPHDSGESDEDFKAKYPNVIKTLKRGRSVRETVKICGVAHGTVAKIRSMIKEELNQQQAA